MAHRIGEQLRSDDLGLFDGLGVDALRFEVCRDGGARLSQRGGVRGDPDHLDTALALAHESEL